VTTTKTVPDPVAAIALLDEPTRRRLFDYVAARHEPVGRDEAAAAAGISRELAAFHLDRLVAAGLLEAEYKRLGSRTGPGAGRPAKLYRRADRDMAVSFPARDYERAADVLADALQRVDAGAGISGSAAVADAARTRGEAAGVEARRNAGPRPSRRRLRSALLDLLRRAGYEPEVAPDDERIRLRSCPYDALVADHRDLTCGMNVAWANGLLGSLRDTGLDANLAPTERYCCVVFEGAAPVPKGSKRSQAIPAEPNATEG
jgi:predicted ArsR family transcriptional regulator